MSHSSFRYVLCGMGADDLLQDESQESLAKVQAEWGRKRRVRPQSPSAAQGPGHDGAHLEQRTCLR